MTKRNGLRGLALALAMLFIVGVFPISGLAAGGDASSELGINSTVSRASKNQARSGELNGDIVFDQISPSNIPNSDPQVSASVKEYPGAASYTWQISMGSSYISEKVDTPTAQGTRFTVTESGNYTVTVSALDASGNEIASGTKGLRVDVVDAWNNNAVVGENVNLRVEEAELFPSTDMSSGRSVEYSWKVYFRHMGDTRWDNGTEFTPIEDTSVAPTGYVGGKYPTSNDAGTYRFVCTATLMQETRTPGENSGDPDIVSKEPVPGKTRTLISQSVRRGYGLGNLTTVPKVLGVQSDRNVDTANAATELNLQYKLDELGSIKWTVKRPGASGFSDLADVDVTTVQQSMTANQGSARLTFTDSQTIPGTYTYRCEVYSPSNTNSLQDEWSFDVTYYELDLSCQAKEAAILGLNKGTKIDASVEPKATSTGGPVITYQLDRIENSGSTTITADKAPSPKADTTWSVDRAADLGAGTYTYLCTVTVGGTVVAAQNQEVSFTYLNLGISAKPSTGVRIGETIKLEINLEPWEENLLDIQWHEDSENGPNLGKNKVQDAQRFESGEYTYWCVVRAKSASGQVVDDGTFIAKESIKVRFYGLNLQTSVDGNGNAAVLGDTVTVTPDWNGVQPGSPVYRWYWWNGDDESYVRNNNTSVDPTTTNWVQISEQGATQSGMKVNGTTLSISPNATETNAAKRYHVRCVAYENSAAAAQQLQQGQQGYADTYVDFYKLTVSPNRNEAATGTNPDTGVTLTLAIESGDGSPSLSGSKINYAWRSLDDPDNNGSIKADDRTPSVAVATQGEAGKYRYECTITSTGDDGVRRVLKSAPSEEVTFYSLDITAVLSGSHTMWDKGADVAVKAVMLPSEPSGVTWQWEAVSDAAKKVPVGAMAQDTLANLATGEYEYRCTATKNGIVLGTNTVKFTIYDLKAEYKATVTDRNWIKTGDVVNLVASGEPAGSTLSYVWYRGEPGAKDEDFEKINDQPTTSATLPYTPLSAGKYEFKCELWAEDPSGEMVVAAVAKTGVCNVYGLEFAEQPGPDQPILIDYDGLQTIARVTAIARPDADSPASGYEYTWYVLDQNGQQTPFEQWAQANGITPAVIPENGTSVLTMTGVDAGTYTLYCEAKVKDNPGVTLTGQVELRVYYRLQLTLDTEESMLLAGQTTGVTATVIDADGQPANVNLGNPSYNWLDETGTEYQGALHSSTGIIPIRGGQQIVHCDMMRRDTMGNVTRIGQADLTFAAMYPMTITAPGGSANSVGAAIDDVVVMTASANPAPGDPKYRWQEYYEDEATGDKGWRDVQDPFGPRHSATVTRGVTKYRCLLGNRSYPTDTEGGYIGVAEYTVSGYTLTLTTSLADPAASIAGGTMVRITAQLDPAPMSGTPSYSWVESSESIFEEPVGGDTASITVSPEEGGIHTYTCSVTLKDGGTVMNSIQIRVKQSVYNAIITTNPKDPSSFQLGEPFTMTASVTNKNPEDVITGYQWQELADNSGWQDSTRRDAKEATMTFKPDEKGTWVYRCLITLEDQEEHTINVAATPLIKITVTDEGVTIGDGDDDKDVVSKPWQGGGSGNGNSGNATFPVTAGAPFTITSSAPYKITGISAAKDDDGVTAQKVLSSFVVREADGQRVRMVDKSGKVKSPNSLVCTGDVVELMGPNNTVLNKATVVVSGDVLGTGKLSLSQIVRMAKAFKGSTPLTDCYFDAADWDGNGKLSITDLASQAKAMK